MENSQSTPDTEVAVIQRIDRDDLLEERQEARRDIENALAEIRRSLSGPITRRINQYHSKHGGAVDEALHGVLVDMRTHGRKGIVSADKFIENFLGDQDEDMVLNLLSEERVHNRIMQHAETLKCACRNTTLRLEEVLLAHSMEEYEAILLRRSVAVAADTQCYPTGYGPCWALGSLLGIGGAMALGLGIHHIIVATASTVTGMALCIGTVVVVAVGAVALTKLAWAAKEGEQKRRARETFQETVSHLYEFWETGDHVLHDLQIFWNIWSEKHHHDVNYSPIENIVRCYLRQPTNFHDPGFLSANLRRQLVIVKDTSKSLAEREKAAQNYAAQCLAFSNQFLTDLADHNNIPAYIIGDNVVKEWMKMRKVLAAAPNNFGLKHAFLRFIDRSMFQGDFSMKDLAESFTGNTEIKSARGVRMVEAVAARATLRLQINEAANVNISLRKFRNIDAIIENELLQKLPLPGMILNVLQEARRQLLISIRSANEDYHPDGDMETYILEYFGLCVLCAGKEPAVIAKLADMFTIDGTEEEGIQLSQTMLERIRAEFITDNSHMALRTQTQVFYAVCTMVCTNLREQATE